MVICLGQGGDLHMAQLMPLPLTVSCSSKSRLVLPSWCWLTWVVLDKIQEGRKMVVCVYICFISICIVTIWFWAGLSMWVQTVWTRLHWCHCFCDAYVALADCLLQYVEAGKALPFLDHFSDPDRARGWDSMCVDNNLRWFRLTILLKLKFTGQTL